MNYRRSFLLVIQFLNTLLYYSCQLQCPTQPDPVVDYNLTENNLTFFNYDLFDTISCTIGDQQNQYIHSVDSNEGIDSYKDVEILDCYTGTIYNKHYRVINYYNTLNKVVFKAEIEAESRNQLRLSFRFYNSTFNGNHISNDEHSFNFYTYEPVSFDTLTINGKYYSDLFIKPNISLGEKSTIYYSKSHGLIRIISEKGIFYDLLE